jgi:hypothetical protein
VEHRPPPARPAEQLGDLHREDRQWVRRAEIERTRVGGVGAHRQPSLACPIRARVDKLRISVDRDHRVPPGRQVQRHPAGSGADVEHGTAALGGKLAPQR